MICLSGDGPIYLSILILLAIACVFTIAGGLTAVIWTDFIQTILMIIGAVVLSILAFTHEDIGGYEKLVDQFMVATAAVRATKEPNGTEFCGEVSRRVVVTSARCMVDLVMESWAEVLDCTESHSYGLLVLPKRKTMENLVGQRGQHSGVISPQHQQRPLPAGNYGTAQVV